MKPILEPEKKALAPDVIPAIKAQSGEGAKKKSPQIIHDYFLKQTGDPRATELAMRSLANLVQRRVARLIQFGNTVFWATQKGPGTIDVHIFTEENPKVLIKRLQQAYQWAKDKGFKKITSTLTDGEMGKILKMSGLPYSIQQTTINNGQQMVPAQIMTMEVK